MEAAVLNNIGTLYKEKGEQGKALDYYVQALPLYKAAGNRRQAIKVLESIGDVYWGLGSKEKAVESFRQTLPLWKAVSDTAGEAAMLLKIGKHVSVLGYKQKALGYLIRTLSINRALGDSKSEALAIDEIGRTYEDLGAYQKALRYFERSLAISKNIGDTRQQAVALSDIANVNTRLGDQQKSIEYNERSLPFWRAAGDKWAEANTLSNMGSDYSALGEKQKALDYHGRALTIFHEVEDRWREAKTLDDIAEVHLSLSESEKAVEAYKRKAQMKKAAGDRQGEADALGDIADIYQALGDYRNELETGLELLTLLKTLGSRRREANVLNSIGLTYNSLEDYRTSLEYHQRALHVWRELKEHGKEADTLGYIAGRYFALGEKQKSLEHFRQALSIYRERRERPEEGQTVMALGFTHYLLGEKQAAWEYFDQILPLLKYRDVAAFATKNLLNAGAMFILFGDRRVLELYERVAAAGKKNGNRALSAASLAGTAESYFILDDRPSALRYFQKALSLYRELGDRNGQAATLNAIGNVYMARQEDSPAQRSVSENAAPTLEQIKANIQRMRAYIQQAKDNARRADELFRQALPLYQAVKNRRGEAQTLLNIGIASQILGDDQKALSHFQKALFLAEETSDSRVVVTATYRLMKVLADLSNPRLAIFYGKQSINIMQSYRAALNRLDKKMEQFLLRQMEDPYRELASLLIGQGRIAEAEQVLAMLKEEEYFEYVRRDDKVAESLLKRANLSPEEEAALKRYKEKADELYRLGKEYWALYEERKKWPTGKFPRQARLNELEGMLADAHEVVRLFLNDLMAEFGKDNVRVREIESDLQKDLKAWGDAHAAAIFTVVGKENLNIVVMTANAPPRPHVVDIPAAQLNELIAESREAVKDPALDPRQSSQRLYDMLVKPIEKDLEGAEAETLIWSLDGALRYVPIAALYDAKRGYLTERYASVIITLSSRTNLGLQPSAKERWQVLGLGVSKEFETFKALTEVKEELRGIVRERAAELGQTEIGVLDGHRLLDEQFTFDAFRNNLGRYPLVHIASHFSFQPSRESDSFLLLGGGDDRKLTIDKIRKGNTMFNGVELLTLSACDTAMGGVKANGEEVESFGLLAQEQGARSVMATLWQVADPSTRELMVKFYQLYSTTPNVTKAEALRRAQLTLLNGEQQACDTVPSRAEVVGARQGKSSKPPFNTDPRKPYAHPYYWAPFILIGNWR
jgi:CHAT domain-containing protein